MAKKSKKAKSSKPAAAIQIDELTISVRLEPEKKYDTDAPDIYLAHLCEDSEEIAGSSPAEALGNMMISLAAGCVGHGPLPYIKKIICYYPSHPNPTPPPPAPDMNDPDVLATLKFFASPQFCMRSEDIKRLLQGEKS